MKQLVLIYFILSLCLIANAAEFKLVSKATAVGSPKLTLNLNEDYFITHTLIRARAHGKYSEDVLAFQTLAQNLNKDLYQKLQQDGSNSELQSITSNRDFLNTYSSFFNTLKNTPQYKLILKETKEYLQDSLNEWDHNLQKSTPFVLKYSGFDFSYAVNVYITHPAVGNGRNWGRLTGNKAITFGAWATFSNYFTVYMWHEIIHFHMQTDDTSHAVNQLLTDNELRVYLNPSEKMRPLEGHTALIPLMEKIFPLWEDYKKSPRDLNFLVKKLQH